MQLYVALRKYVLIHTDSELMSNNITACKQLTKTSVSKHLASIIKSCVLLVMNLLSVSV